MPLPADLLATVLTSPPAEAWGRIADHLWAEFHAPISGAVDAVVVRRDRSLTELDNVLSGTAWDLWDTFEEVVPRSSKALIEFWGRVSAGKAVLILDGLSLRETPWLLLGAQERGYTIHQSSALGSELPAETTAFANALGFSQRSALENNGASSTHKLPGAATESCDLPFADCVNRVGSQPGFVFWHHWPDVQMHHLAGPGLAVGKLAKETHASLMSDDFWSFVERLTTGRRLVITGDHGSDLLICRILMWGQVGRFGLTGDRVDESQIGDGIGELGRVEMFQQMSDCAVGPRVRHRMDVHTQDPLLQIGHQVGLRAKQIAQQAAGIVCPGQFLTHD